MSKADNHQPSLPPGRYYFADTESRDGQIRAWCQECELLGQEGEHLILKMPIHRDPIKVHRPMLSLYTSRREALEAVGNRWRNRLANLQALASEAAKVCDALTNEYLVGIAEEARRHDGDIAKYGLADCLPQGRLGLQ